MKQIIFAACILMTQAVNAQGTYFTKSATVRFDATAKKSPEEIKANQKSATFVMTDGGAVEAAVLIKSFLFKQALMQEHFNENYMESDKYPKATFKGKVKEGAFSLTKDGTYKVTVEGNFTMHGVTKPTTAPATIVVKGGKVSVESDFTLPFTEYGVAVPSLVADKVGKEAKITIKGDLGKKK
jgi:polyisoprenoid-binding protein YceI